jgi:hypothetical protein
MSEEFTDVPPQLDLDQLKKRPVTLRAWDDPHWQEQTKDTMNAYGQMRIMARADARKIIDFLAIRDKVGWDSNSVAEFVYDPTQKEGNPKYFDGDESIYEISLATALLIVSNSSVVLTSKLISIAEGTREWADKQEHGTLFHIKSKLEKEVRKRFRSGTKPKLQLESKWMDAVADEGTMLRKLQINRIQD